MSLSFTTGKTFANGETVTPSKVNQAVNSATYTGELEVAKGGTGAATAADARTNLGLGTGDSPTFTALTLSGTLTVGGLSNLGGTAFVASDFSKTADISAAAITGLSITLASSKSYAFRLVLFIDCAAAGGYYFDLNGGTATATTLRADGLSIDQGTVRSQVQVTALSSAIYNTAGTAVAPIKLIVDGFVTINAGGTFIPRFAQASSSGTASTIKAGSYMQFALLN